MGYVTDAKIDDGPRICNTAQDGNVYIYDEANGTKLVLSKQDIEFIDPALEKTLSLLIKELIILPASFDFPTDAEIEAKKTEDWIPPKLRLECDEMTEYRIKLSLLHGDTVVDGSTICFTHTNGIITMESMMFQMRHEPSQIKKRLQDKQPSFQQVKVEPADDESMDSFFNELQSYLSKENGAE